tara:strand:- start:520 stop:729 length:210 start_codon:yes stop_codon:yes gene_type:complete
MARFIDTESIEFQNYMRNSIADALDEHIGEVIQLLHEIISRQSSSHDFLSNTLVRDIVERMEDKFDKSS